MSAQVQGDLNTNAAIFNSANNTSSQLGQENRDKIAEAAKIAKVEQEKQAELAQLKKEQEAQQANENVPKDVEEAVEIIAEFMNLPLKNVNFAQDDNSEKTVIKVFDSESKELIKQFPSEEVLEIAGKILALRQDVGEKTGIFLDEKV